MEAISFQVTITVEGMERVVDEMLVTPKEDDTPPGKEEFEAMLTGIRDELYDNHGIIGPLNLYRVDRTLEANVPAVKQDLALPPSLEAEDAGEEE